MEMAGESKATGRPKEKKASRADQNVALRRRKPGSQTAKKKRNQLNHEIPCNSLSARLMCRRGLPSYQQNRLRQSWLEPRRRNRRTEAAEKANRAAREFPASEMA